MAGRTAGLATSAGLTPLVVADAAMRPWAQTHGIELLHDPGGGLDGAAAAGVDWCSGLPWLVLHADLPLLTETDLHALVAALQGSGSVIAPSSDGGTSALGSTSNQAGFSYGLGSFRRHLGRYPTATVVARPGLLLDLDTPEDLEAARCHASGRWLQELIPKGTVGIGTTRNVE